MLFLRELSRDCLLTLRKIIKGTWCVHDFVSLLILFFSDVFQDCTAAESVDDPPEDFVEENEPQWMGRSRSHSSIFGGFEWNGLV